MGLIDSTRTELAATSVDLSLDKTRLKRLDREETRVHLSQLRCGLGNLRRLVANHTIDAGDTNSELGSYLGRLESTLDAIVLRHRMDSMGLSGDISFSCSINPTGSGFPLFLRDFYFLEQDKDKASLELESLPDDERLVRDVDYTLFRGVFPSDLIFQKLKRNYFRALVDLDLPSELRVSPPREIQEKEGYHLYTVSAERLDGTANLPRFYIFNLAIPNESYQTSWKSELETAIRKGISSIAQLELPQLAHSIEHIEGVTLRMLKRFDIGPFYNQFTNNNESTQTLLTTNGSLDSLIQARTFTVMRLGQHERKGFSNWWKSLWSGDRYTGIFSPALASPVYTAMPHRAIQYLHHHRDTLHLGDNLQLYGITEKGDLID